MHEKTTNTSSPELDIRSRIIQAAAALIEQEGREAATTRAVATAAGVQAPAIYRLFGDKRGLLDVVAEHTLNTYVSEKSTRSPHPDPIQDLRNGWDLHVAFGLAHPEVFAILADDPQSDQTSPAVALGNGILRRRVRRIAQSGQLRTSENRAIDLLRSMSVGTVRTLLGQPENIRDLGLSVAARDAVIVAITGETNVPPDSGVGGAAAALRSSLDQTPVLSDGEKLLLEELLDRISRGN